MGAVLSILSPRPRSTARLASPELCDRETWANTEANRGSSFALSLSLSKVALSSSSISLPSVDDVLLPRVWWTAPWKALWTLVWGGKSDDGADLELGDGGRRVGFVEGDVGGYR